MNLGAASLFAIDNPAAVAQQPAPVDLSAQRREAFDDFMSVLSVISIVLNLTR